MLTTAVGALATPATADDTPPATATMQTDATAHAGQATKPSRAERQRAKARRAVKVAKRQIGDPYRWGAAGPRAFDCSGLVQFAWRKAGVRLPRTTWAMLRAVKKKVSWRNLKAGDLIFTSGGGHVGMYVGNGKMIHAPHSGARVRIDRLDSYRKRTFVGAVRPGA